MEAVFPWMFHGCFGLGRSYLTMTVWQPSAWVWGVVDVDDCVTPRMEFLE